MNARQKAKKYKKEAERLMDIINMSPELLERYKAMTERLDVKVSYVAPIILKAKVIVNPYSPPLELVKESLLDKITKDMKQYVAISVTQDSITGYPVMCARAEILPVRDRFNDYEDRR